MNRDEFIGSLEKTFKVCLDIAHKKNSDYAQNTDPFKNFKFAELIGLGVDKAILVRISDKLARISNLTDKKSIAVLDENLEDTIIDAINYLAILKAWLESSKEVEKINGQASSNITVVNENVQLHQLRLKKHKKENLQ